MPAHLLSIIFPFGKTTVLINTAGSTENNMTETKEKIRRGCVVAFLFFSDL